MNGADALPVRFDERGLVPAIAQDAASGEVLMLAWMNRDALDRTRATGEAHYFSRSRNALWRKGERSGQTQRVLSIRLDCDGDTLLLQVEQAGVACHTGHRSCFYRELSTHGVIEREAALIDPATLYAP